MAAIKVMRRVSASLPPTLNPSYELFHTSPIHSGTWTAGSMLPPDRIDSCLRLIVAKAPEKCIPFNINCRSQRQRWSIRGIRITKDCDSSDKTNVILVSGKRSKERHTIAVNLSVAAMVAEQARTDFTVSVVPNLDPREYERLWKRENAVGSSEEPEMTVSASGTISSDHNPVYLSSNPETSDVSDGYLHYYIKRLGNVFSSLELNFSPSGASLRHKKELSFNRPPETSPFDFPHMPRNDNTVSLPIQLLRREEVANTYVVELRDKNSSLGEDQIEERADQVMSALRSFLAEKKRAAKAHQEL